MVLLLVVMISNGSGETCGGGGGGGGHALHVLRLIVVKLGAMLVAVVETRHPLCNRRF